VPAYPFGRVTPGAQWAVAACTHLDRILDAAPSGDGCTECVRTGSPWVHLRRCTECGHVGCCDSSPNHHATAHFHESGHPIMQSFEPGEDWYWCFVDEIAFQDDDAPPSPSHP
jgi:uncharacterized UBP type Zn finger protein